MLMRSPRDQDSRCWRSSASSDGPVPCSGIVLVLQAELGGHTRQGAMQFLPQGDGVAADLGGDGRPVVALVAQIDEDALVGRQAAMDLGEQIAGLGLAAG